MTPPPACALEREDDEHAKLIDHGAGLGWYFFFFPGLRLDLRADAFSSLRRDVEAHANALFEAMQRGPSPEGLLPAKSPRSPLVSCEVVEVESARALSVIHRMANQPGREIVMGHLLVPARSGLLEARWIAAANQTGFRESVLLMKAMQGELEGVPSGAAPEELMTLIDYDAPKYDALFPQHALSLARHALSWAVSAARVTDPAPEITRAHSLAELACDVTVPPRFALEAETKSWARFHRVSLAGNDGVQRLVLERDSSGAQRTAATLSRRAESRLVDSSAEARSQRSVPARAPLQSALVVEGEQGNDRPRIVAASFVDADGGGWLMTLSATDAQAPDALLDELADVAQSLRPRPRRAWWKVWN